MDPDRDKEKGESPQTLKEAAPPRGSKEQTTENASQENLQGSKENALAMSKETPESTVDDTTMPKFEPGFMIKNEYKIVEKLDEGGFGQVFKGESIKNGKFFAIKIEPSNMEGGSAIKLEMDVLTSLCAAKVPHFPQFYHAGRKPGYQYVIMELLGPNLKSLRQKAPNPDVLTVGTWSRIGIQCLYVVKLLHDSGFVHRDIKPSNFAMGGPAEDSLNGRMIYLLDFGLARRFILKKSAAEKLSARGSRPKGEMVVEMVNELYKFRKPRINAEFRGTHRYASPNAHALCELGRADDLYSLLYMLIEMYQPLPWATTSEGNEITTMKMFYSPQKLVGKYDELIKIFHNLNNCQYYSRPSYELFYETVLGIMNKANVKMNDAYDWDDEETYDKWIKLKHAKKVTFGWENGLEFFKKDPWEIKPNQNLYKTEPSDRRSQRNKEKDKEHNKEHKVKLKEQHHPTTQPKTIAMTSSPPPIKSPFHNSTPLTTPPRITIHKRDNKKLDLKQGLTEKSTYNGSLKTSQKHLPKKHSSKRDKFRIGEESKLIYVKINKLKPSKESQKKGKNE